MTTTASLALPSDVLWSFGTGAAEEFAEAGLGSLKLPAMIIDFHKTSQTSYSIHGVVNIPHYNQLIQPQVTHLTFAGLSSGVLMKRALNFFVSVAVFGPLLLSAAFSTSAYAAAENIASHTAEVDGVKLHYLTAGHGPALILLHGYAETSLMWKPIIPVLAERFTVIAPDLPGIGDSAIPNDGLDMKTAAIRMHALARSLGVQKSEVVGHDIGLMVAYAYAAQFPAEVTKLVVMDAFLPGVAGWEAIYNDPNIWHFRFHGPTPEALVQGRERLFFEYFWNDLAADKTRSIPEADRKAYAAAYSRPGRMRAGWAYFVSFQQAAKDFAQLSQTKLTMPVLVIGGEKSLGDALAQQMKLVASDVTVVVLKDTGHWVLEERPKETTEALVKFL
jgi:pimeloyl-ACP methyl ester carboxylesterase